MGRPTDAPRHLVGMGLKMYLGHSVTLDWMRRIADVASSHDAVRNGTVELFALPTFPALVPAVEIFAGSGVLVGAQDLSWEDAGPFTGEVSGSELAEIGCSFVEVGHAERRRIFGESDDIVAAKTAAAFRNGLRPVICVGEATRLDPDAAADECLRQLDASLLVSRERGIAAPVVLAYEPQWAIGAAAPAEPPYIRAVCDRLREALDGDAALAGSRLIYGGSAGPGMVEALDGAVDGLFLGRSAHDPDAVAGILDEFAALH